MFIIFKCFLLIYPISLCVASPYAFSEGLTAERVLFSITPRLCVLVADGDICRDDIELRWQSSIPHSVCMYQNLDEQPLACWKHANFGTYTMQLSASESLIFYLRDMSEVETLSTVEFSVIKNNNIRRKRRSSWSFF